MQVGTPPHPQTSWVRYPQGNLTQQWPTSAPTTQGRSHIKLAGSTLYWTHSIYKAWICPPCWCMFSLRIRRSMDGKNLAWTLGWLGPLIVSWKNLLVTLHCTTSNTTRSQGIWGLVYTPRLCIINTIVVGQNASKMKANRELVIPAQIHAIMSSFHKLVSKRSILWFYAELPQMWLNLVANVMVDWTIDIVRPAETPGTETSHPAHIWPNWNDWMEYHLE